MECGRLSRLIIGDLDLTGRLTGCFSYRRCDMKENKKSLCDSKYDSDSMEGKEINCDNIE